MYTKIMRNDQSNIYKSVTTVYIHGAFKVKGLLIFLSEMEAGRNVKVVGEDVAVL